MMRCDEYDIDETRMPAAWMRSRRDEYDVDEKRMLAAWMTSSKTQRVRYCLGDLGSKRGDLFGEFVGGIVDCSVVFGEEMLNLRGDGPVELFHKVVGDYFEICTQCSVLGAHWGLHLGGCVDGFVGISANCLGLGDMLGGLEVHGIIVCLLFSFLFVLVAGVGSVFRCRFAVLAYSLGRGGGQ